jgi:prevent-host-death family protein
MKQVAVRDLQKKIKVCVDQAQKDRIIITRRGKPSAVLIGIEGHDWETVVLETNPTFWKMIRKRRNQSTFSIDKIRSMLDNK